jgi:hypothetical protein
LKQRETDLRGNDLKRKGFDAMGGKLIGSDLEMRDIDSIRSSVDMT